MKKLLLLSLTIGLVSCGQVEQKKPVLPPEVKIVQVFQTPPKVVVDKQDDWIKLSYNDVRKMGNYAGVVYKASNLKLGSRYLIHFVYKMDKINHGVFFTTDPTWDNRNMFYITKKDELNKELKMVGEFKATSEFQIIPFILEFPSNCWIKDVTVEEVD